MNRIAILMLCLAPAAFTQDKALTCDDEGNHGRDRGQYCEMREVTVPAGGHLDIDGGNNGGVSVKGSNRSDILVRSKVQAYDDDQTESRRVAGEIRVETSGGHIRAVGPSLEGRHGWGVSFEILVPQRTDLALRTHNGGISIYGVQGHISFEAVNGGVQLQGLAGSVEGHTTNGGVHLELAQDHWDGDKWDVSTTNCGVPILGPAESS